MSEMLERFAPIVHGNNTEEQNATNLYQPATPNDCGKESLTSMCVRAFIPSRGDMALYMYKYMHMFMHGTLYLRLLSLRHKRCHRVPY